MPQKALIYCRVSSKRQLTEGSGLESQEHRCRLHAERKGYEVDMVFPDDISGGGNFMKRPGMVAMLSYLRTVKDTSYVVIFDDLKRLSRSTKHYLMLKDELAELNVQIECLNFTFDESPEGEFYETIIAAGGEMERKQGARQVRQKIIARFESGYWGMNAPLGYKMRDEKNKPRILIRDEPIASYIEEALEGFACGRFQTQAEVKHFLDGCPEFPRTKSKGVHPDTVKKLLTRTVYAGMVELQCWGIGLREGHHEGLISLETYHKNQERLLGKARAPMRKDVSRDFILRGAVCCADCNKPYTSTWSKGRNKHYPYYLCAQKGCESYGKSIRRDDIEGAFDSLLKRLSPSTELIATAIKILKDQWTILGERQTHNKLALETQIEELDTRKSKLLDKLIQARLPSVCAAYEQRIEMMEVEEAVLQEKIANCGSAQPDFYKTFRTAMQYLANPHKLWASEDYRHKKAVLRLTFTDHLVYDRKEGFRTAPIALPVRLLGQSGGLESKMVDSVVFEPTGQATFSHVSPRIGLRWQLMDDFSIQASWGESFRAPNFTELLGSGSSRLFRSTCAFDPHDPRPVDMRDNVQGESCGIAILSQANPDLNPETASNTSLGFVWTPAVIDGLAMEVNLRRIDFNDRIAFINESFVGDQGYVDLDDGSGEFVVRRDDGRINYFVFKSVNFAKRRSEVVDFNISYDFDSDFGDLRAALDGVYTGTLEDQFTSQSPVVNLVGTNRGPEDWKGRASLSWDRDNAGVNLFVNYSGSYENEYFFPGSVDLLRHKVGSYWTVDVTANYDFDNGWRLELGSNNLTNNLAPFFDSELAYDPRVYNPTGRNVYAEMKKSFDF